MTPDQLKSRLEQLAPGTQVVVNDLTGTQDHYEAHVVSPAFAGKLLIQQHQLVMALVKKEMDSGELHALSLKTRAP